MIEGFKSHSHPKLEVHRPAYGKELLAPEDKTIVVVASDGEIEDLALPLIQLNDPVAIAAFIVEYLDLKMK